MEIKLEDPSDWLETSITPFAALENSLRCQVCKDFFTTPMVTSCSHTFCSICIRRCLSNEGKCPACRTNDQASKLRRNWAIEEVVGAFRTARPVALDIATREKREADEAAAEAPSRPSKRRRVDTVSSSSQDTHARTTRSQSKRMVQPTQPATTIDNSDNDSDYNPDSTANDGLVECPICSKRMKEEAVYIHMDTPACNTNQSSRSPVKNNVMASHTINASFARPSSNTPKPPPDRLAELNYSLLKENALRKKLQELGIPGVGSKSLLIRRHTEWVNLWNANVDAGAPRTKRELLDELRKWDRAMGREPDAQGAGNTVMRKDFDADAWKTGNKTDFDKLIEQARKGRKTQEPTPENATTPQPSIDSHAQPDPSQVEPERDLPNGYHDATVPQETAEELAHGPPASAQSQPHQLPSLGNDTSLPEHFSTADQKMSMFEVPSRPVHDTDDMNGGR